MSDLSSSKNSSLASDREIQLRRETLAAMRLRALWRHAARRHSASSGASTQGSQPGSGLPGKNSGRAPSSPSDSGEHTTRILLISDYDGLRSSSERLLRKHGYEVVAMTSQQCLGAADLPQFDIAVLCQSIECDRVPYLSRALRHRNPDCWLLRVASLLSGIESGFDARVDAFGGPAAFLATVDHLIHGPRKSA